MKRVSNRLKNVKAFVFGPLDDSSSKNVLVIWFVLYIIVDSIIFWFKEDLLAFFSQPFRISLLSFFLIFPWFLFFDMLKMFYK